MGIEQHSYGLTLRTFSRRRFVMATCGLASAISTVQLLGFLSTIYSGGSAHSVAAAAQANACTGTECYEIWSCFGWKDATLHWREPLGLLFSMVLFGMGFFGAASGDEWQLQTAGNWLLLLGAAYIAMAAVDTAYVKVCAAYPSNLVYFTLAQSLAFSPVGPGVQQTLRSMTTYPVGVVDGLTGGLHALAWHLLWMGSCAFFVIFVASEARVLARLCGRGPLGLGVNYGLDQWDEAIDHDALRIQKAKCRRSRFVEDATLPLPFAVDEAESRTRGLAMATPSFADSGYGAAKAPPHLASNPFVVL